MKSRINFLTTKRLNIIFIIIATGIFKDKDVLFIKN